MPKSPYPPISDYALISDCHSMALVGAHASIDWCCMPRLDAGSSFGRLLDWKRGGYCSLLPAGTDHRTSRAYVDGTLVLKTTFRSEGGEAELYDCFTMHEGGREYPHAQLLRIVRGVRGRTEMRLEVVPRFDYGEVRPWIRHHAAGLFSAIGGNDALVIWSDADLQPSDQHDLRAAFSVQPEECVRVSIQYVSPERLEFEAPQVASPRQIDSRLQETIAWWRKWSSQVSLTGPFHNGVVRSAIVLKGLTNAPTGAIAAATTTSLPESPGGTRNWDYRYSWIRDSSFSARSLAEIGCYAEADGFRRFIERSSAGSAHDLQIVYGVGGERRLTEVELELEGYRGARPVRIGNGAATQLQLDAYGELLDLSWRWHQRGHSPDDDYWRFLVDLVDAAATRWSEPDRGIWEIRGDPQHFVHSKALCWVALDRGISLAEACLRKAPSARWKKVRRMIKEAIDTEGYDAKLGAFVQAFGSKCLDSSVLLLPVFGFCEYRDERMVKTSERVSRHLSRDGLIRRYDTSQGVDGVGGDEGSFLACTFWLVEVLARQGQAQLAREYYDRAVSTANDLGLFAEEFDMGTGEMLGNFPQGLSHLSHIEAAVALSEMTVEATPGPGGSAPS
ncbi:MAG: glycoside hydrolase family 15 protein [Candidatus Dormibacteraceae bacterium]